VPIAYKVLGQSAPSATTNTTIYTCPSATQVVVSSVVVCNRGAAAGSFRIAVRPNGDALANQHYIAFDSPILGNETVSFSIGLTIDASDLVVVYASSADMTFALFGSEIT
jgi:hypothetical protein